MKIRSIQTIRPAIQHNLLFVVLRTDDGVTGLGEAFFGAQAVEAYIHETAAPLLIEMTDVSPESAAAALAPYVGFQGAGAEVRGNAAIDFALWDALGHSTGRPLVDLLGGAIRPRLEVYNTCAGTGYVNAAIGQQSANWGLGRNGIYEDLDAFLTRPAELARNLLDSGIRGMKVWPFDRAAESRNGTDITREELAAGIRIISEIREEVGLDMKLMVELHGLWNRPAADKILTALEPSQPYWVEDPIRPDTIEAYRFLRGQAIPIAVGETVVGRRGALPLLQTGAVDVLTLDLQWCGGLTEARKTASLADTFGVPIAPHDCTGPVSLATGIHLSSSQPNALIQETCRAFIHSWYAELVEGVPEIVDGWIRHRPTPGHGISLRDSVAADPANTTRITDRSR